MPKLGDYLIRRNGSNNWYFQLMIPSAMRQLVPEMPRKIMRSTGTDDRIEARAISGPWLREWRDQLSMIGQQHKRTPASTGVRLRYIMEPDTTIDNGDGTVTVADKTHIRTIDKTSYKTIIEKPNWPLGIEEWATIPHLDGGHLRIRRDVGAKFPDPAYCDRIGAPGPRIVDDTDTEIIENWAHRKNVNPRFVDDAKATLEVFRQATKCRTFANADYDDGCALADALFARGLKSATVRKKVAFLRSAFNEAKLSPKRFPGCVNKDNPFSKVIRKVDDDALDKVMLDDSDVALIKSRMDELGRNERVLLTWCLATGCRRGEPFEVTEERVIDGLRTIRFGKKTLASDRTIPLPPILIDLYPQPITGHLFTDSEVNVGKRVNAWFRKIGITDPGKTLHSTRHRAAYRLRKKGIKDSVRHECLGHEDRNEASEQYGAYPQEELNEALSTVW